MRWSRRGLGRSSSTGRCSSASPKRAARKLKADAGSSRSNPLRTKFLVASGGTGQMLSVPMNEFVQQSFAEIGIAPDFRVVALEPLYAFIRFFHALLIWVVHDTNPRVLGRNARGCIQAQHRFQDLTTLS